MANRLQKLPELTYVRRVEAVTARKAYCTTESYVASYRYPPTSGGSVSRPPGASTSLEAGLPVGGGSYSGGRSYSVSPMTPVYGTITRCYPAVVGVVGVAPRIDKSANNGWNGGARSIADLPVGSYIEVDLPDRPIGVLVGLSQGQLNIQYSSAKHALVSRPDGFTAIQNGQDVTQETALTGRVRIMRTGGEVRMFVGDDLVHSAADTTVGTMYVVVMLYSLSDYVENPAIGAYGEYSVTSDFQMQSYIDYKNGDTSIFRIETTAVPVLNGVSLVHGTSTFRVQTDATYIAKHEVGAASDLSISSNLTGYGYFGKYGAVTEGISYAAGKASSAGFISYSGGMKAHGYFPEPTLEARANPPEAETVQAVGIYPSPELSGHVLSGAIASADGAQLLVGKASDTPYFGGKGNAATTYRVDAWFYFLADDHIDGSELLLSQDIFSLESNALFILHEGIGVTDTLDFYLVINLDAYEAIAVGGEISLSSIIQLAISERMAISGSSSVARREALQYAVNATTGALSTYQNFGFKQFATVAGETYAITDNGLFRLTGDTDNGDLLNASIDFGASDFGTSQLKRVSSVYAGVATDGEAYIRVTADEGQELVYRAITEHNESRVKTAKGLAARHWRVRLELTDASYADLDNLEIEIGVSQRRLR